MSCQSSSIEVIPATFAMHYRRDLAPSLRNFETALAAPIIPAETEKPTLRSRELAHSWCMIPPSNADSEIVPFYLKLRTLRLVCSGRLQETQAMMSVCRQAVWSRGRFRARVTTPPSG